MPKSRQSAWRLFGALGMGALFWGGALATEGCGFGNYNDSNAPQAVTANSGVWDAGQWWPWACKLPDGTTFTNPSAPTTPINYTATGTCGAGGAFALSVDGCEMQGNWDALGLADVATTIPSSIPEAGGWEVTGTGAASVPWICDAAATDDKHLTFSCAVVTDGGTGAAACTSTLEEK